MSRLPGHVRIDVRYFFTCDDFELVLRIGNLPLLPEGELADGDIGKAVEMLMPDTWKAMSDGQKQSLRPMTADEITACIADEQKERFGTRDEDEAEDFQ